ncbi:MAG: ABC transporter ATP-binding protein [Actinobacteria bacterium]|nr:ABC transporter ATP-binding protein [Actinomycetota bacterium]
MHTVNGNAEPEQVQPVAGGGGKQGGRETAVTITNLVKRYGSFLAVDEVSLSIREGEIFGIIGPNGAGKTTTVECIAGLRVPDSGSISVYGLSPQRDRDRVRDLVGVQLQESALPPRLKVGEALELFAAFYANPLDPQEVLEALAIKHIEGAAFKNLSGGQKQRVSIALALVGNPKIAILDELTTGLDPEARRETWAVIERMRDRGVTVILVTHFMDEAETLCDRLALINRGRVRALDTPEAIAAEAGMTRVRFAPSRPVDDEVLRAVDGVKTIERKDRYVTVTGKGDLAAPLMAALAAAGVQMSELEARRGNLDDAFIELTKDTASEAVEEVRS